MYKVTFTKVEEFKEKLLALRSGIIETSGKHILAFTKLFGVVSATKFEACNEAYHKFVEAIETEEYVNGFFNGALTEERQLALSNQKKHAVETFIRAYEAE